MRPLGHLVMAGFYSAGPGVFDVSAAQNMKSQNAYYRVFSCDALEQSWRGLLRSSCPSSRNTVGYNGRLINDFARDPKSEIRKLITELRAGEFNFSFRTRSLNCYDLIRIGQRRNPVHDSYVYKCPDKTLITTTSKIIFTLRRLFF